MMVQKGDLVKFMEIGSLDEIYGIIDDVKEDGWVIKYPLMNAVPRSFLENPPKSQEEGYARFLSSFHPIPIAPLDKPFAFIPKNLILIPLPEEANKWLIEDIMKPTYENKQEIENKEGLLN